jgi:hypothetical protein
MAVTGSWTTAMSPMRIAYERRDHISSGSGAAAEVPAFDVRDDPEDVRGCVLWAVCLVSAASARAAS